MKAMVTIPFFTNKASIIFLLLGVASLSTGLYQVWQIKFPAKHPQEITNIEKYQKVSKDIKNEQSTATVAAASTSVSTEQQIMVDVSGAVKNPGIYPAHKNARISELLDSAGGIDQKKADIAWVARNINLATKLNDGDKIYIPNKSEALIHPETNQMQTQSPVVSATTAGLSAGNLGYQQAATNPPTSVPSTNISPTQKISINSASKKDLDTLPGVGEVTAQKIIDNRPYTSLDQLKSKKAVNNSVYQKILEKITL